MAIYTATQARANLFQLIAEVVESHEPIHITSKKTGVVMIAEEDWSAIQETLYLQSVPGISQSIQDGLKIPIDQCDKTVDW